MYHLPLRTSAAIASGVALVSLFGAASPALAKGGHHHHGHHHRSHAAAPVAPGPVTTPTTPAEDTSGVDPATPATPAEDTPGVDPATPAADPSTPATTDPSAPATDTPPVDTPVVVTPPVDTPVVDTPAPDPSDCLGDAATDGTTPGVVLNSAGDAGCVAVAVTPTTIRLAWVAPAAGWTYEVERNGGGTNDRVQIRFTQTETGDTIDFRYEMGKTSIG